MEDLERSLMSDEEAQIENMADEINAAQAQPADFDQDLENEANKALNKMTQSDAAKEDDAPLSPSSLDALSNTLQEKVGGKDDICGKAVAAYFDMIKLWRDFSGITNRQDFWLAYIVNVVVYAILGTLSNILPPLSILLLIYSLATIIPTLSISVRRLHDIGRSGWWLLLLATIIGIPVVIYFFAKPSKKLS